MKSLGRPIVVLSDEAVQRFQEYLLQHHISAFVRQSRGRDISAACGQLRFETRPEKQLTGSRR